MIRHFLLLSFGLFICACSTFSTSSKISDEQLLIRDDFDFQPKENLTEDEVEEDLQLLVYALKNGYGGRKYVPQETFEHVLKEIEKLKVKSASSQSLCEEIEKSLTQIDDLHLSVKIKDEHCSPLRKAKFKTGSVGRNFAKQSAKPWELNFVPAGKQKIPVLSITSLPSSEDSVWDGFLKTVLSLKMESPAIIIDLRGNGGGADTMGLNMADFLFGQDSPTSIQEIIKSQTAATFAIAANSPKARLLKAKAKKEPVPRETLKRYQTAMENFDLARAGKIPNEKSISGREGAPFDPNKAFAKPILVLTDRECASSCESTLETLILHRHVVTIGENTAGLMHFGNVSFVILPHSQLKIQLATDFWKYKDGRFLEGIGYQPQIQVASGQDALNAAIEFLVRKK